MGSLTPKTQGMMYHTSYFIIKRKLSKLRKWFCGHLGILLFEKVAQGCQSGNQATIVLKWSLFKNHQKNFIGKNISRSAIRDIGLSNRLFGILL